MKRRVYWIFALSWILTMPLSSIWGYTNLVFVDQTTTTVELPKKGICAHRGASETHPENTVSAFNEAVRLGVQMIEFDVQRSQAGHAVVSHD